MVVRVGKKYPVVETKGKKVPGLSGLNVDNIYLYMS